MFVEGVANGFDPAPLLLLGVELPKPDMKPPPPPPVLLLPNNDALLFDVGVLKQLVNVKRPINICNVSAVLGFYRLLNKVFSTALVTMFEMNCTKLLRSGHR